MKAYLRMYRWAMQMKLHMAMYTFVAIFLKAVTNLLQGMKQMDIMELLSMWGVCLAFAMIALRSMAGRRQPMLHRRRHAVWMVSRGPLVGVCGADRFSGAGAGLNVVWRPVRIENGQRPADRRPQAISAAGQRRIAPQRKATPGSMLAPPAAPGVILLG